jgi:hypothetical protein
MGEDLELADGQRPTSHRRILKIMAAVSGAGTLIALGFGGPSAAIGFAVGCGLSVMNYLWLESSLRAMFSGSTSTATLFVAARYIFRYFLLGGALLLIYLTGVLPVAAVIAGLAAFALAALVHGFRSIRSNY